MARWATVCVIAGVTFTGCRAELIDATEFKNAYVGSVDWGNDGTVHAQNLNRGVKGIPFGIKMVSALGTSLSSVFSAVATAQGSASTFRVQITDGIYSLDLDCIVDLTQDWVTHGKQSEGWYEDVVFRFISKAQHV